MVTTPELTPYTTPVVAPTVPIAVLLLLHVPVPPVAVASANVMVNPVQTDDGPVIAPAKGDTLTVKLVVVVADPQKALVSVKVIIVVPALTPYITPVTGSMVPTAVLLLLHVPVPPDAERLFKVVVKPAQTDEAPVIVPATGDTLTVMLVVVVTEPQLTLVSVYVIVVTPELTPYTTPVVAPTVPTAVLLLLHVPVPPVAVASDNVMVKPVHTDDGPVMAPANGDTLTVKLTVVVAEPQKTVVSVNDMIVVPALTPYTTPVAEPTVPTAVLLLLHVPVPPDAVRSFKVVVKPAHTVGVPVIVPATGDVFTVMLVVVVTVPQLTLVSVNVIVVTPAPTPYTTPVTGSTVPTAVLLLLQVPVPPKAVASDKVIVNPVHTDDGPVIVPADGVVITLTFRVVIAEPQLTVVSVNVIVVVPTPTP